MKKIILTAAAVFAFSFDNAQDSKFGVKGGLSMSSNSEEGAKSLLAFHLGAFAEFKVSDKFAVQPELLYSAQGAKFSEAGASSTFNLNYINIPVMAKFNVAEAFTLEVGPQIGFLMSAKAEGVDFKELCNSTDFGLNFGAGYNLSETTSLGLRYNMGLSDVLKNQVDGSSKNSSIQLSFGYKF